MAEKEFVVHCAECGHQWVAAYLPMTVDDFVRVSSGAKCPRGCLSTVLCGATP